MCHPDRPLYLYGTFDFERISDRLDIRISAAQLENGPDPAQNVYYT